MFEGRPEQVAMALKEMPKPNVESRRSGVQEWANNLEASIQDCQERFAVLTKKLEAVLAVETPEPIQAQGTSPVDHLVPLAAFLHEQTVQMKLLAGRIESVMHRVEV